MEFGVLELGLKNKKISNINIFLRIQSEGFKIKWLHSCENIKNIELLINEWDEVFTKINKVLKQECNFYQGITVSSNLIDFSFILIRISIQVINQLLLTLNCDEKKNDEHLYKLKQSFQNMLLEHSKNITSFINKNFENLFELKEEKLEKNLLVENLLIQNDWTNENQQAFFKIKDLILNNQFEECEIILKELGLPIIETLNHFLNSSSDLIIIKNLICYLKDFFKKDLYEQIILNNKITKFGELQINFKSLLISNDERKKNLIITNIINNEENCLKLSSLIDDESLFNYFLICNEKEFLIELMNKKNDSKNLSKLKNRFNKIELDKDKIDTLLENSQVLTKNFIQNNLFKNQLYLNKSTEEINLVIKRLYNNDNQSLCVICKTGLLSNYKKNVQERLINYALEIENYDFLYWYFKQENNLKILKNSKTTNTFIKNIILSLFEFKNDNESYVKFLNIIIQNSKYLNQNLEINNINDLFKNNLILEAICCIFLAPTGFNDSSLTQVQLWYMEQDIVVDCLKKNYPILNEAFNYLSKKNQFNELSDHATNFYSLFKGTIVFDINKIFYWQKSNKFGYNQNTMPTFSNKQLADKFGLKATLNYIYYLTRGRPIEAYYQQLKIQEKLDENSDLYEKVCLLAFYNCQDSTIVCSCVAFLELFHLSSSNLTFQIAISRLIIKFASDFLTLNPDDYQEKMGSLLEKACFEKNILAQTNILELIYMALGRKYEKNEKPSIKECIDYEIAVLFARKYSLELPTKFIIKCIQNDNWLLLTVFIQIYDYPKDVFESLLKDTTFSSNNCVADHLVKAFSSISHSTESKMDSSLNKDQLQSKSRTKNNLYQRIVQRKINAAGNKIMKQYSYSPKNITDLSDIGDSDSINAETLTVASSLSEYYDGINYDELNSSKNLFNLLMICQKANSIEPWKSLLAASVSLKNPVPALIAASLPVSDFENEHLFECCCCWLFASFKLDEKEIKFSNEPNYVNWSFKDFKLLLSYGLRRKENLIHFYDALQLFLDCNSNSVQNPLIDLLKFFIEFLIEKNYHESLEKLLSFIDKLKSYKSQTKTNNIIYNQENIDQICYIIIECSLRQTSCLLELHLLLHHLEMGGIHCILKDLSSKTNLTVLFDLIKCIYQTNCDLFDINIYLNLNIDSIDFKNYMKGIVHHLQSQKYFFEAKELSVICKLNIDSIIINELIIKSESQSEDLQFWNDCLKTFKKNKICLELKQNFLRRIIDFDISKSLKCFLLLNFITDNDNLVYNSDLIDLHLQFYNHLIELEQNYKFLKNDKFILNLNKDEKVLESIWTFLIKIGLNLENQNDIDLIDSNDQCLVNEEKEIVLCKIIGYLLDNNCIKLSYIIANIFKLKNINLNIIQFCSKIIVYKDLDKIDSNFEFNQLIQKLKKSYDDRINKLDIIFNNSEFLLYLLERLYEKMTLGRKSLQNIILKYKINIIFNTNSNYLNDDEENFKLLIKLIENVDRNSDHFQLAKELIQLKNITDKRIVNYVCDNIEKYLLCDQEELNQADDKNRKNSNSKILIIIRLLNNPSVLGKKFMHIMSSFKEITNEELSKVLELCIKAHECFKLANDIEGIALVLQKVRVLIIKNLSFKKDYDSMIRLLIGINRYSEMSYVFDILKENHELELLLSKKVIKNLQLRIALVDFLKRDRDMYQMITLNFSMHREIAELLENQAKLTLRNIKFNANSNLNTIKTILEDVMQELIDASESYSRADCYTKSDQCAKLAQLVALQISYFSNLVVIINLNEAQAYHFINTHPKFFEAHILADAYGLQHNWCTAIFNNIIINGDWQYYRDYTTYYKLTAINFEEIMSYYNKFKKEKEKTLTLEKISIIKQNVQKLVTLVDDLKLMYKYSVEHNLISVSASLMDCPNIGYIKDLKRQNKI